MPELEADKTAFYTQFPFTFIKADQKDGNWNIYMEASNEMKDLEGEKMLRKALEDQKDYFLSHGVISYEHLHKAKDDPTYIIGEPIDVKFTDDRKTLVKARLYKENKIAKGLFPNLLSNSSRFGASVGGYILAKGQDGTISKVLWDETAVTAKPVNQKTQGSVSVIPFEEFGKSLTAGAGVNAAIFDGGRSLTPENLEGSLLTAYINDEKLGREIRTAHEAVDLFNNIWIAVMLNQIKTHGDLVTFCLNRGYSTEFSYSVADFIAMHTKDMLESISVPPKHDVTVGA